MLRKTALLLSVFILFNILCIGIYSCRCKTRDELVCTAIKSVDILLKDDGGLEPRKLIGSTVSAKALILNIKINRRRVVCQKRSFDLGISAAYAMCKEYTDPLYEEPQLGIYADRDYDSGHLKGADLQKLFIKKGDDYFLMTAPDDTSGTYIFKVQVAFKSRYTAADSIIAVYTPPLKLKN